MLNWGTRQLASMSEMGAAIQKLTWQCASRNSPPPYALFDQLSLNAARKNALTAVVDASVAMGSWPTVVQIRLIVLLPGSDGPLTDPPARSGTMEVRFTSMSRHRECHPR